MTKTDTGTIREAVGVFDSAPALEKTIDDLEESGFDRAEISLLASEESVKANLGQYYQRVGELQDEEKAPRTAFVSKAAVGNAEGALIGGLFYVGALTAAGAVVASGGALAGVLLAGLAGGGAGGAIGGLLARVVGDQYAGHFEEQLGRGGILLWVRTTDSEREKTATGILKSNGGRDVHVHEIAAAT